MSDTAGSRSDGFVDQLLLEADMDDDGRLRPALLELRALADEAPAPSAETAALMAPARAALESAPAATEPAGEAPGSTEPAGSAPGNPTFIPAYPAAAAQPAAPPSDVPVAPEAGGSQQTSPGKPGEVPASAALQGAVPEHVAKGLGKAADVPVPPQVPVPGILPAVPLP